MCLAAVTEDKLAAIKWHVGNQKLVSYPLIVKKMHF